jgi:parallel beta-helix repeat protein
MIFGLIAVGGLGALLSYGLADPDGMPRRALEGLIQSASATSEPALQESSQATQPPRRLALGASASLRAPVGAIAIAPGTEIQSVVNRHPAGTAFLLKSGVHRLQSIEPKDGNAFYGEISADGQRLSILNGSRQISQFGRLGQLYVITGQKQKGKTDGKTEPGWERSIHPEDLFINNRPLKHVGSIAEVKPGTWFFDYAKDTVYFADNPTGKTVEIGTTRTAFLPTGSGVKVYDLVIEKYATPAQVGAIGDKQGSRDWVVEGNEVRLNHGVGVKIASNSIARGNYIHSNGQKGISAREQKPLVEGNEIAFNNYANYRSSWDAGGSKFVGTNGLIVRGNYVHHNRGPGLWTDIKNINTLYENNVVYNNQKEGIFHEISYDAIIRNNRVGQNGLGGDGKWLYGSNILVSTSKNVQVYGNEIEANEKINKGIGVIWQARESSKRKWSGDFEGTGNQVFNNRITYLGPTGLSGAASDTEIGRKMMFKTNSFNKNTYYSKSPSSLRFAWANKRLSFSELQQLGQEAQGSIVEGVTPLNWSALRTPGGS